MTKPFPKAAPIPTGLLSEVLRSQFQFHPGLMRFAFASLIAFGQFQYFVVLPKVVAMFGSRHSRLDSSLLQFFFAHPDLFQFLALTIAATVLWVLLTKRGSGATKWLTGLFLITLLQMGYWAWVLTHMPSGLSSAIH